MGKFFAEFKKFITRGNVVDMAVGVIVGSAFTAIVNGLSNNILKPLINYLLALIFGKDSLTGILTMLMPSYKEGVLDLATSIYIDWGAFINAVLNFFIIAFVLFCIVRVINRLRSEQNELKDKINDGNPSKADRKEMRARGIKFKDTQAVAAFYAEKAAKEAAAKAEAAEKARLERLANPTTEDLLKSILEELKNK